MGLCSSIFRNLIVGLTVSFVALSLGAALGVLSGRGAEVGMLSAGIIAIITSLLGGTRIQCSGPTAPMAALFALIVHDATTNPLFAETGDVSLFLNVVLIFTGLGLLVLAVTRVGHLIGYVPEVVISGFMSGIALLIWDNQWVLFFGSESRDPLGGTMLHNGVIILSALLIMGLGARVLRRIHPHLPAFLPTTLLVLILIPVASHYLAPEVEHVQLQGQTNAPALLQALEGWLQVGPKLAEASWYGLALHYAVELALLCFLDTMLTALVMDRLTKEASNRSKELAAQGVANALCGLVGGVPGAQATIRSVMIWREGATMRLAGVAAGCFVLIEMLTFQSLLQHIPQAVFIGILIKVGWDVFDWTPWLRFASKHVGILHHSVKDEQRALNVIDMSCILATMVMTWQVGLNEAVISMSVLYMLYIKARQWRIREHDHAGMEHRRVQEVLEENSDLE